MCRSWGCICKAGGIATFDYHATCPNSQVQRTLSHFIDEIMYQLCAKKAKKVPRSNLYYIDSSFLRVLISGETIALEYNCELTYSGAKNSFQDDIYIEM